MYSKVKSLNRYKINFIQFFSETKKEKYHNFFRTYTSFEAQLKKGIFVDATTYILPTEICAMVNVVLDAKSQSLKLCAVDGVDVVRFTLKPRISFLSTLHVLLTLHLTYDGNAKFQEKNKKPDDNAKSKKVY